jgi:hypothetical protein
MSLVQELRYLMRITLESPSTLAHLVARTLRLGMYDEAKRFFRLLICGCGFDWRRIANVG